jgi:hypothetical protein
MLEWGSPMHSSLSSNFILSKLTILAGVTLFSFPVEAWYRDAEASFEFCKSVSFENPICPPLSSLYEVYASPTGDLTDQSLLLAATGLKMDRPAQQWLEGLNLTAAKPKGISEPLWNQARWIYAQSLHAQKKFAESSQMFDQINHVFKRRSVFHQQRAWVQYFAGQFDKALGSIVSAESPLTDRAPFLKKYLLKALIERDTCQPMKALQTIASARRELSELQPNPSGFAMIKACQPQRDGELCEKLSQWYQRFFAEEVKSALKDLDFLEAELSERNSHLANSKVDPKKPVEWSFVGEAWLDELGNYTVQITESCAPQGDLL